MRKLRSAVLVALLLTLGLSACMTAPSPEESSYGPNGLKPKGNPGE